MPTLRNDFGGFMNKIFCVFAFFVLLAVTHVFAGDTQEQAGQSNMTAIIITIITAIVGAVTTAVVTKLLSNERKKVKAVGEDLEDVKEKLTKLQKERENVKNGFKTVVSSITDNNLKEGNVVSKISGLFGGYTEFHRYVICCISFARYKILEREMSKDHSEELRTIILGLIEAGFPKKLHDDVNSVWDETSCNNAKATYRNYKDKLNKHNKGVLKDTTDKIDDYIEQYAALSLKERAFKNFIETA